MTNRHYRESAITDSTKRYTSDLDDQEFEMIAPYVAQKAGSGKKRTVDIREVLNAIFYRIRTGCQWRMLPSDFPSGIMSGITIEHGGMMAPLSESIRCCVAMFVGRQVAILNQVLPLSIAKVLPQRKWVERKGSIPPNK